MTNPGLNPSRRDFLQTGAAAGLALGALPFGAGAAEDKGPTGIPMRPFGKTGEKVTLLGVGGFHAAVPEEPASLRMIQRAVDEGITFFDNAWDYMDGLAEERMGKALAEGNRRDKIFLMTKCCGRTAKDAQSNLEDSLRRLRTDHLDLWQFHEINYDNDPDWIFAAGGALEFALKAKEQGKVRHIGFTGHKHPEIHLKMLGKPYDWVSVQMPLNVMDGHYRSFQRQVLPVLNQRGIAAIGMKSLGGRGGIVKDAKVPVDEALRYVFSLPIATLVCGIDSENVLDQNLKIVRELQPMTREEMAAVEAKYLPIAGDGRHELFKSAQNFDGEVHRKQHGFQA
ncbi:General stress protein 69 [Aquisphaera giovannonii]|uniref:General stress protein 69 n=1 Tax=Aquisphaera giovannonii TaxID=406548 RepID=A0A5B9VZK8_9BACT|nr:aldo/keto reductase [Aquisphaera giovannonii]QEH33763.1 General stress protein 69 [Aquisphaera giovannonii]